LISRDRLSHPIPDHDTVLIAFQRELTAAGKGMLRAERFVDPKLNFGSIYLMIRSEVIGDMSRRIAETEQFSVEKHFLYRLEPGAVHTSYNFESDPNVMVASDSKHEKQDLQSISIDGAITKRAGTHLPALRFFDSLQKSRLDLSSH
jgi:hypothetical protein